MRQWNYFIPKFLNLGLISYSWSLRFLVLDVFTFLYFYHGFMLTVTKSTDHVCSASYVFLFFLSQFFWFVNNSGLSKSRCIRLFELVCEAGLSSKF